MLNVFNIMCYKRLILIFCVLFFHNGAEAMINNNYTRIVGGEEVTNLADFPYQVSLRRFRSMTHFCGGIILDSAHILTAAHCMFSDNHLLGAHELYVVTGSLTIRPLAPSVTTNKVKYIFVHEEYNPTKYNNDIAILRLRTNITLNNHAMNIPLSTSTIPADQVCIASGWGTLREGGSISNKLMSVRVPIVDHAVCEVLYKNILTENMLCAGIHGKDACQGDSGGPIKCRNVIAGIVSFGSGCGKEGFPGVYTDVSKYGEWIEIQIDRDAANNIIVHFNMLMLMTLLSIIYTNI